MKSTAWSVTYSLLILAQFPRMLYCSWMNTALSVRVHVCLCLSVCLSILLKSSPCRVLKWKKSVCIGIFLNMLEATSSHIRVKFTAVQHAERARHLTRSKCAASRVKGPAPWAVMFYSCVLGERRRLLISQRRNSSTRQIQIPYFSCHGHVHYHILLEVSFFLFFPWILERYNLMLCVWELCEDSVCFCGFIKHRLMKLF